MWSFYIATMVCVGVATFFLLRFYAAPGVPLFVQAIAVIAWVTSLSIVALVPVDVLDSLLGTSGSITGPLGILWSISYWSTQVLCWAVVPLTSGFVDAGEFTFAGRSWAGLKDHAQFWIIMGSLSGTGLLVLLISGRLTLSNISPLALTLSNTYGLVAGVFLLGYGLVEIPRGMWNQANPEERLRSCSYRLGRCADTLEDAASELQSVITVVEATSQPMSRRDPMRPYMDIIYKYAQDKSPFKPSMVPRDGSGRVDLESLKDSELDYGCDQAGLAELRHRTRKAVHNYEGQFASYVNVVTEAFELENVCKCRASRDYTQKGVPIAGIKPVHPHLMLYKCVAKPWVMRLAALLLGGTSFMVVWSEATIGLGRHPDLSPFSLAIHKSKHGEMGTLLLVLGPLVYMVMCCQYSLLRLGFIHVFTFRHHVVPHCTHSTSLLRNGAWACRFTAPICYNYLHVIRMQDYLASGQTMVFSKKMGAALNDVPLFGTAFNNWFPVVVLFWCGALFLNVWQVIARLILPARFQVQHSGSNEHLERGQVLIRKEQDASLRGMPIASCLDIWGTVETPATSPAKSRWFSRSQSKDIKADAASTKPARSRSDMETAAAEGPAPSPWSPGMDSRASQGAALQQGVKGGLDQIFARMSPGADDDSPDKIDDDGRDGTLLGGQEDSLYGSHHKWKREK
ncbi:hypothetical protein WJX79_001807 [Trebouxia sp. C0005]